MKLVPILKNSMKLTNNATVVRAAAANGETPRYVAAVTTGAIPPSCLFKAWISLAIPVIYLVSLLVVKNRVFP